ncbi:MAG: hypothetical protein AAGA46_08995 [Cyanobacteria bacterium P01_F01_bin.13]
MEHVKQTIRRLLQETLTIAQKLPVAKRRHYIRQSLENIQDYCATFEKTFIVRELIINCDQYELGGCAHHYATLFRGPSEDASVAICITEQGSLLHRNDSPWTVYCNAGDVNPVQAALAVQGAR